MSDHLNAQPRRQGIVTRRRLVLAGSVVAVAAAGLFVSTAFARDWGRGGGRGAHHPPTSAQELQQRMQGRLGRILTRIGATDAQVKAIDGVIAKQAPEFFNLATKRHQLHADLAKALQANTLNRKDLEKLRSRALDLMGKATEQGIDAVMSIGKILTPVQRGELLGMWRHHHGPGMMGRPGMGGPRGWRGRPGAGGPPQP